MIVCHARFNCAKVKFHMCLSTKITSRGNPLVEKWSIVLTSKMFGILLWHHTGQSFQAKVSVSFQHSWNILQNSQGKWYINLFNVLETDEWNENHYFIYKLYWLCQMWPSSIQMWCWCQMAAFRKKLPKQSEIHVHARCTQKRKKKLKRFSE